MRQPWPSQPWQDCWRLVPLASSAGRVRSVGRRTLYTDTARSYWPEHHFIALGTLSAPVQVRESLLAPAAARKAWANTILTSSPPPPPSHHNSPCKPFVVLTSTTFLTDLGIDHAIHACASCIQWPPDNKLPTPRLRQSSSRAFPRSRIQRPRLATRTRIRLRSRQHDAHDVDVATAFHRQSADQSFGAVHSAGLDSRANREMRTCDARSHSGQTEDRGGSFAPDQRG